MLKIATLCFLGLTVPVSAIVVDNYGVAEAEPSAAGLDLNWEYVHYYKGSSAVAVGGVWILTAGHVADDVGSGSLTIDGIVYTQQAIVPHPTADLALVRVDKLLPGYYELYTGYIPASLTDPKLPVLMVGYGTTGSIATTHWTEGSSGRGIKRWGSQEIDLTQTDEFWMYFNTSRTAYEAGAGQGDSGGGVFYKDDDTWKLAGINISVGANADGFNRTNAMSMPYYADWIAETIPEPAAIGLLGFGTVGLFLARSKRRRKLAGRSLLPVRGDEPLCDLFCDEAEADGKERVHTDYMAGMVAMIHAGARSAWIHALHNRYMALNKAFWCLIETAYERKAGRKEAVGGRVSKAAVTSIDAFLDMISWDRIVISVKSGRSKAARALRMGAVKSLDAFLDAISWDQMMSVCRRCRKGIILLLRKLPELFH